MSIRRFSIIALFFLAFIAACSSATSPTADENVSSGSTDTENCLVTGDCDENTVIGEPEGSETEPAEDETAAATKEGETVKAPKIINKSLDRGVINEDYEDTLTAKYGTGKYVWSITSDDFKLVDEKPDDNKVLIVGKPTKSGEQKITVTVKDADNAALPADTKEFTIKVADHIAFGAYDTRFKNLCIQRAVAAGVKSPKETVIFVPCTADAVSKYEPIKVSKEEGDDIVIDKVEVDGRTLVKFKASGHGKTFTWDISPSKLMEYHPVAYVGGTRQVDTSVLYVGIPNYDPLHGPPAKNVPIGKVSVEVEDDIGSRAKTEITSLTFKAVPAVEGAGVGTGGLRLVPDGYVEIKGEGKNILEIPLKVTGGEPPYEWSYPMKDKLWEVNADAIRIASGATGLPLSLPVHCRQGREEDTAKFSMDAVKKGIITLTCELNVTQFDWCRAVPGTGTFFIAVKDKNGNTANQRYEINANFSSMSRISSLLVTIKASDVVHIENTVLKVQVLKDNRVYGETGNFMQGNVEEKNPYGSSGSEDDYGFDSSNMIRIVKEDIPISDVDKIMVHVEDNICADCSALDVDVDAIGVFNMFCYQLWEDTEDIIDEDIAGTGSGHLVKSYTIMSKDHCSDTAQYPGCWDMGGWHHMGKGFTRIFE